MVAAFDASLEGAGCAAGEAEADVDGRVQAALELAVVEAERLLEGADHVADDVFRAVVKEGA